MKAPTLLPAVAAGLGRLEDFDLALQVCERIVAENPAHHQAFFGIAYYRNRLGALLTQRLAGMTGEAN